MSPDQSSKPRITGPVRWALVAGVLVVAALTIVFRHEIADWLSGTLSTFTTAEEFRDWVEGFGAWAPLMFVLAQAAQVIIVPVPGAVFPPVGSLAFGPWPALLLSLIGMGIGSAVVFLAARRWGRPFALRLAGEETFRKYETLIEARGNILLWLVFVLPLLPDDAICALAGVSKIPFRRFMVIAVVGRIPAVAAGVFTMAGLERAPGWVWLAAAAGGVLVVWLGAKLRRAIEHRIIGTESTDREAGEEVNVGNGPQD